MSNYKEYKKEFTFGYFDTLRLLKDNLSEEHFKQACKQIIKAMEFKVIDLVRHDGEWFYDDIIVFVKKNKWVWELENE